MDSLFLQRCFNHAAREAVARCPECKRFFCRECVSEHDDRVICTACLKKESESKGLDLSKLRWAWRAVQAFGGVFLAWLFFYVVGQILLSIPSTFHEGTVWNRIWDQ